MPDEEIDRPVKKINPVYSKMCCSFTTFFFSRIGLCLIVIAYSIGGGFIFKSIESPIERHDLAKVQQSLDAVVQQLLTQSNKYLVLIERNWTAMAREEILKYQDGIIRAVKQRGYLGSKHEFEMSGRRGSKSTTMNEQWNTAGAVLYAVTVITSIGDFVPGRSLSPITNSETVDGVNDVDEINTKSAVEGKLVLCAIYLMIGLSLLVMCFNLVEEEVRAKCRRVGIQLGIYDDDDISRMMNIKTTIGMDTYYAV
ncbi:hypothetical protein ACOME3_007642 [Neoechinorhynchus agilis]